MVNGLTNIFHVVENNDDNNNNNNSKYKSNNILEKILSVHSTKGNNLPYVYKHLQNKKEMYQQPNF